MSGAGRAGRLARLRPGDLDPEQADLYRTITGGPRASGPRPFPLVDEDGRLEGPFNAMLLRPALGAALQELGAAVRYRGGLPDRAREIAILLVAHHWESSFEVHAHEAVGRAAGLSPAELAAVRLGEPGAVGGPDAAGDVERAVARATAALLRRADLTDAEFAAARAAIGVAGIAELTTLVGYYGTLALQMRVFGVETP